MKRLLIETLGLCTLAVAAASAQPAPACRVADAAIDQRRGNAGCLIAVNGKSLVIVHSPGGRLGFPGGTARDGESAQCTAHRETWEETGLDLEVGEFVKELSTGFLLYVCRAEPDRLAPDTVPALPSQARSEVSALQWRDLDSIAAPQWRFPEQVEEVRGLDDP